jgi:hypothetical protein
MTFCDWYRIKVVSIIKLDKSNVTSIKIDYDNHRKNIMSLALFLKVMLTLRTNFKMHSTTNW